MKLLLLCFLLFSSFLCFADEEDDFSARPDFDTDSVQRPGQVAIGLLNVDAGTYTSGSTITLTGKIPSGSVVTFGFIKIIDDIEDASTNTIQIGCDTVSDLANGVILGQASAGTLLTVVPDGTVANSVVIDNACTLEVKVNDSHGSSNLTEGRANAVFYYVPLE